ANGVSTSATVNGIVIGTSSGVRASAMAEIVGRSLIEFTVTVNVRLTRLFEALPSFTVTVIVTFPFALVAGTKRKLPVLFGLAYVTAGLGIICGLLETAFTLKACDSLGA